MSNTTGIEFTEWSGQQVQAESTTYRLGECLGEGAEGAVYRIEGIDDHVVKIFKADKRDQKEPKLRQMVQDDMTAPGDNPEMLWTTWPGDIVSQPDSGSVLGYTLPYLDTDRYIDAQRYASKHLQWTQSTLRERIKPALNLVMTVNWLHENGYAIGDLSEQNIRVHDGSVTLIDCDSYSIEGSDFSGLMEDPRYTPPEGRGTSHEAVIQTDAFGVTTHIFQFMMGGFHPFQAVGPGAVDGPLPEAIEAGDFPYGGGAAGGVNPPPPAPPYSELPDSIQAGFTKCFSTGLYNPEARPPLEKWLAALSKEGGFDLDGIDASGIVFETNPQKQQRLGKNWQENIRQGQQRQQRQQRTQGDGRGARQGPAASNDDTHWADNIRGTPSTTSGSSTGGSASTGRRGGQQSPAGAGSSSGGLVQIALATGLLLLVLFLLVVL